ncbi:MAG: hypothetical protein SGCHY_002957 [Lobulomycetales sp.]
MRYDSSSSVSMENMSQVPACDNTPAPSRQQLRSNLLMPNANPFVIDFTCAAGVELRLCESAQAGFISAANRISQVIAFPQTVRVKATFRSFCNGTANRENCELADTLGQASPAAYFSARPEKEREAWYFYPQALIKQVMHDVQLVYNEHDIIAEFNADFNFWFSNDGVPIESGQTDFEFVVSHEFTHGLGFDTAWTQWGSLFPSVASTRNYLAPLPFVSGSSISTATVPNWQPLTIFDRFTQDSARKRLIDWARDIYSYENLGSLFTDFVSGFEKSGDPFTAAQDVLRLVTGGSGKLYLQTETENSPRITLQTGAVFRPGSSIAHMDLSQYLDSSDFLMIPAVQNLTGMSLDDIIASHVAPGGPQVIYGEKTMALLTSMGYTRIGADRLSSVIINSQAQSNPIISAAPHKYEESVERSEDDPVYKAPDNVQEVLFTSIKKYTKTCISASSTPPLQPPSMNEEPGKVEALTETNGDAVAIPVEEDTRQNERHVDEPHSQAEDYDMGDVHGSAAGSEDEASLALSDAQTVTDAKNGMLSWLPAHRVTMTQRSGTRRNRERFICCCLSFTTFFSVAILSLV